MRNEKEIQEDSYLVRLAKSFLPQIIFGALWVSVALAILQAGYADNRKRIDALATDKADKAVIETQNNAILQRLDDLKEGQIRIENLFIEHISK